ncbi:aminotransferase class III-fold pyridoxal phosphate-dependent enzyme [Flavihumibacter sp. ZG627]|uniref:aminotransferase class III-fold pyridoxal phosphate-dependent enzyme n=1 Tax=Flavihumibacter sp. ZG627 TaxID=1463156 RepID=UPI00057F43AB|nr:aminotransferase class III-fold pyridoxal phosphate-dependent enzyme [Flavihumibacter sp. ZG627]KIC89118.1 aminotransferase [Flavihumibacter sp. ZG627]
MYLSAPQLSSILQQHYGLSGKLETLQGYDEQNALLTTADNRRYICKVASEVHDLFFQEAQVAILLYLQQSSVREGFQNILPSLNNQYVVPVSINETPYYVRVIHFLEGDFLVNCKSHSPALLYSVGDFLGRMDQALKDFKHPAMHRHYEWDISNALDASPHLVYISNPEQKRLAAYFLLQFETLVLPALSGLRKAYIHNDANDYNLLVTNDTISGLIDFGDMVYAPLINNLAVACTYAMLHKNDPLSSAVEVVKAYHQQYPLLEKEVDLLYYLVAGRLCISVGRAAYNRSLDSSNEHHFVTENAAWKLLYQLIEINPLRAQQAFREVCGMPSCIQRGYDHDELMKRRFQSVGRNLSISYRKKLKIEKGALQYLYDDQGNTYVDCVNNVSHVGHCHPVVVKAMQQQLATLNTNTRYLNDHLVEYAEMLTATLPSSLKVCYFTNSGSEANDLAIRMSRHYTGQKDIIVLDHAYHGTSTTAIEMSPYKFDGKGGFGRQPYIHKAMNPDGFRGPFKTADTDAGAKYAADIDRIIASLQAEGKAPAAFICETLLGVGGQIPLPAGYLAAVYDKIRKAGGVCIADEVQVGFGRVGEAFWGFELQDVIPDIVVMGKPIGNGHPLAAVVVTEEIANAFNNGMEYFNTYGGNPVSMVTGKAVLQVIQEEGLQAHAWKTGTHLLERLRALMPKHGIIGDVRGHGLFIGVELIRDHQTLEPAVPEIDDIVEAMKERGFLLSTDGPLNNVLKIKPPLVFSKANADAMVTMLDEVMTELGY